MLDISSQKTVFCPVSVGNPQFNKANMGLLLDWAQREQTHLTIVIFDSLRILTNLIKGRDLNKAVLLSRSAAKDTERMVMRLAGTHPADFDIRFSSQLLLDTEVLLAKERIRKWSLGNDPAFSRIQSISERTFQRLGLPDTRRNRVIQFEYLVEESAVALTYVEKDSVLFELYPRNEDGLIDFLFEEGENSYPQKSSLSLGRKFKSWSEIGIGK